jgi:hypothetical protein
MDQDKRPGRIYRQRNGQNLGNGKPNDNPQQPDNHRGTAVHYHAIKAITAIFGR